MTAGVNRIVVAKDGNYGVIDKTNKTIVPFDGKYQTIEAYSEGMAPVTNAKGKWGFIDLNGVETAKPQYDYLQGGFASVDGFSEGLAAVGVTMKGQDKWAFIDKNDHVIIPLEYDEVRSFSEGLAGVCKGDKWGFLDKTGKMVIPLQFDDKNVVRMSVNFNGVGNFIFTNGVAEIGMKNDKPLCIDKKWQSIACLN